MPTHMRQFFSLEELQTASLHEPFEFTKEVPVLKINRIEKKTNGGYKGYEDTKSALYNLKKDPGQLNSLQDDDLILKYKKLMIDQIKQYDPPKELLQNYFNIKN